MFSCFSSGRIDRGTRQILDRLQAGHMDLGIKAKYLSRYEQCLIQLARALAAGSDLIVMDTIFEMLSGEEQLLLGRTVRMLADGGIGFLLTSRLGEYLMPIADRISVIRAGRNIRTFARQDYSPEKLVRAMSGAHYDWGKRKRAQAEGKETALRMEQIFLDGWKDFLWSLRKGRRWDSGSFGIRKTQPFVPCFWGSRRGDTGEGSCFWESLLCRGTFLMP